MKLNIRFQLRLGTKSKVSKADSNRKATLRCHISVNGEKEIPFSTGLRIYPADWNQEFQTLIFKKNPVLEAKQQSIELVRADLLNIFNDFNRRNQPISTRKLFDEYVPSKKEAMTFLDVYDKYMSIISETSETDPKKLSANTYRKYVRGRRYFGEFLVENKTPKSLLIDDVTDTLLERYYDYLAEKKHHGKKVKEIYAYVMVKQLERVFTYAMKKLKIIDRTPFTTFGYERPPEDNPVIFQLDEADLLKIFKDKYLTGSERKIIDGFLFMTYSTLAYSDYCIFAKNPEKYVTVESEQYSYIDIKRFKNRKNIKAINAVIPLTSMLTGLLNRYEGRLPVYSNATYNRVIKDIAHRNDIKGYGNITTHVARKSGAKLFGELDGVDISTVSKILGHSREATTRKHYYNTSADKVKRQVTRGLNSNQ